MCDPRYHLSLHKHTPMGKSRRQIQYGCMWPWYVVPRSTTIDPIHDLAVLHQYVKLEWISCTFERLFIKNQDGCHWHWNVAQDCWWLTFIQHLVVVHQYVNVKWLVNYYWEARMQDDSCNPCDMKRVRSRSLMITILTMFNTYRVAVLHLAAH